ncbi:kinase-like domain-containing protein, partial [Zopfochytrium polystomum]
MATSIPSSPSSPGVTCFRPLPLSGAEKRFITYVDRFRFGEESARAVLNSVCPDPIRPVLSGLIDVLDFLAGNYLLLVSNKEAAANLGFSCSRAAESICTLVRTSASHSWAVDPSNHAVPDFVDLLTQIIEYVNDALAPRSKNYYRRVKDLVQVRKVKEELERFGKKLNDQLAMIQFSVNVSNHEALANLLAKEKADNRLLDDHSKQRQEEELQEIKSAGISIQVEAAKLGDAVPEVVRHKLEDIVLAVRKRGILIRQETQLGNLSLEESDLIKIDTEVDMVVALAHKVEKQFGLPLHLEQWMISSRDVQFQEVDDFCLGRGVSSIVYKGKMAGRGFVAVKVFKFDDVTPDKIERSITKEIESWRMVSDHPTILTLFGISTKIKYFLVSELCESTARKHLSVIRRSKTTAEWSNAVSSVLADTADALRFIHQQNIVHHDVKGNNILIRRDGSAALGDFDLARTIGSLSSTTTTQTKGTLNWCSPEQLLGPLSQLTAKTDTWSFGMTIFELLKDDNPYGDYLDAKSLIVADSPTLPTAADIPTELSFLVDLAMNCCKKHPADR